MQEMPDGFVMFQLTLPVQGNSSEGTKKRESPRGHGPLHRCWARHLWPITDRLIVSIGYISE